MTKVEILNALKSVYHDARALRRSQPKDGREAKAVKGFADKITDGLEPIILALLYEIYELEPPRKESEGRAGTPNQVSTKESL